MNKQRRRELQSGAQTEIDILYNQYYTQLVLWADTILKDMDQAEDVVQELFIRLWEKKLYETLVREGVKAYLYTAVRNLACRRLKNRMVRDILPDLSVAQNVWEDMDRSHEEIIERVLEEIEKLPPRSREILECVHLKNMKYAEVAEKMGISVATVKTLLVRSIKSLRRNISDATLLLFLLICEKNHLSGKKI